ncbi:MAG: Xaa-Pro peptidase family protein [Methanospirillum sp.]|uniref:M24 family metallopeptidase n=1 Tax=Methanospirillum sp. TaxID=45200 RepID=UPI002370B27D|nr:Xaa-Pro peptidase family protein [Methanospirillum sp.]MDD1730137.1 Xaa-Pro peptidase family protein [Methanospirillum sp.]
MKVPFTELDDRMSRFRARMDKTSPDWELAAIIGKIPLYYFTGTMQDGILLIPQDNDAVFWVRQSYERAIDESCFPDIRKMRSYRDVALGMGNLAKTVYLETGIMTISQLTRLQKHLPFSNIKSVDEQVAAVRALKSPYEIALMEHAGSIHRHVLEDCVPDMLRAGIDEASLTCELYSLMVEKGHQGIIRFGMFNEMLLGQIGFGTNSLYPTCINSPGGIFGMHPSTPLMGSRDRKLKNGDLVNIDIGCGYKGYQTDKTMTYMFGSTIPEEAIESHIRCVELQNTIAAELKPGAIPSAIYREILEDLEPAFLENFMGYGKHRVNFLGHGIGLWIDEYPVIAQGFDEPLQEGMVFALEPKKGIPDVGLVGIENTFLVTPCGGRSITGMSKGLVEVF